MAEWPASRPNLVRVRGLGRTRMGGWHVEVSSGWKNHAATLCGLQLPSEYVERNAEWSEVGCEKCQRLLAEAAARDEAKTAARTPGETRRSQQANETKPPPKPDGDDQGSLF